MGAPVTTKFRDLKIGAKFVRPGGEIVHTKWSPETATSTRRPYPYIVAPDADVVPEVNASVADILGSWRSL